nr:hypothetical protein [Tanacetum cinerariifolium]
METSLPKQLSATLSKVLPSLLTDTLTEHLPELLYNPLKFADTLKELMPDLLSDSLKLNLLAILIDNVCYQLRNISILSINSMQVVSLSWKSLQRMWFPKNKGAVDEGKKNEQAAPASVPVMSCHFRHFSEVVDMASEIHLGVVMIEER